jgi:uncharacterized repeat protein (TIGR03803 family)
MLLCQAMKVGFSDRSWLEQSRSMKSCKSPLFKLITNIILGSILVGQLSAQTFTTLYNFAGMAAGRLCLSGNVLYWSAGALFALNTDGTGFTNLYTFAGSESVPGYLICSGNRLYGTTLWNGLSAPAYDHGAVFVLNTNGTGFANLHNFTDVEGVSGHSLIISGVTLYGLASFGGTLSNGTVFKLNTDGTGYSTLHNFGNGDGCFASGLTLSSNRLYGTALNGGSSGKGTVFVLNTDGTGFRTLYNFTGLNDGAQPAGMVLSGNTLYSVANRGGSSGNGTVFALQTDGTGFTNLHVFTATTTPYSGSNSDGAAPFSLILSGNTLYGVAQFGGSSGDGTIFAVQTDGTGFMTLHSFTAVSFNSSGVNTNRDGANPECLTLSGNTLYGTTIAGGNSGNGTIFSLSFTPQLGITPSGSGVVLSWPTNYDGFDYSGYKLQSTTNLDSLVWITNLPAPLITNGQNTVTNPISGTQQFFRLSQ